MALLEFHLFPDFPPEVRLAIWEFAMEPREVVLSFIQRRPSGPTSFGPHQPNLPPIILEVEEPKVTLRRVCRESRAAVDKFYPVLTYVPITHNALPFQAHVNLLSFQKPFRFNRHLDTLRLNCSGCSPVDMIFGNRVVAIQPRGGPHSTRQWPPSFLAPTHDQQASIPRPLIASWYQNLTHLALHERVFLSMQYTWRSKPAHDTSPPTWACLANWLLADIEPLITIDPNTGRSRPSSKGALGIRTLDIMLYRAEKDRASDCTPFRAQNEVRVRYRTVRVARFPRPALSSEQDIAFQEHQSLINNNAVIFSNDFYDGDVLPRDFIDLAVFELIGNENEARHLTNMDTGPGALQVKKTWITVREYYRNHCELFYNDAEGRYPFRPFDLRQANHWGGNAQWLARWAGERNNRYWDARWGRIETVGRNTREGFPVHGVCLKRFGFGTTTGR